MQMRDLTSSLRHISNGISFFLSFFFHREIASNQSDRTGSLKANRLMLHVRHMLLTRGEWLATAFLRWEKKRTEFNSMHFKSNIFLLNIIFCWSVFLWNIISCEQSLIRWRIAKTGWGKWNELLHFRIYYSVWIGLESVGRIERNASWFLQISIEMNCLKA